MFEGGTDYFRSSILCSVDADDPNEEKVVTEFMWVDCNNYL